jgi:uncharacterized delta-60 repeat protein
MLAPSWRQLVVLVQVMVVVLLSWPPDVADAAAGDQDETFGGFGKVTTNLKSSESAFAVAIQADKKIIAAGFTIGPGASSFALVRYNIDGSLDETFGNGGVVSTDFDLGSNVSDLAIQSDGKIVAAGTAFSNNSDSQDFAIVRYNANGSLDSSFGSGGKVITDFFGGTDQVAAIAIQSDGKIVLGGNAFTPGSPAIDFTLARYNADGTPDSKFGDDGKVTTDFFGEADFLTSLEFQSDGKLIAAGTARIPAVGRFEFALARYTKKGRLDQSFGSGGKVTTEFGTTGGAAAMAVQTDDKIVVAGDSFSEVSGGDFALLRYSPNGALDSSFGSGGRVTTDILGSADQATALAISVNGKIVVGGNALLPVVPRNQDFAVARYRPDGTLDAAFGVGGKTTTDFSGSNDVDSLSDLAIQTDGKIVAVGGASIASGDFALARYETVVPRIATALVNGKRLSVFGQSFDDGAIILINGEKQKTANDASDTSRILIGKKAGKKIGVGDTVTLQVQNSDGALSLEFRLTRQ